MKPARLPLPESPPLEAFRQVVRDGVARWAAALVERAVHEEAASPCDPAQSESPIQRAQQALTHALAEAMRAQGDAAQAQPAPAGAQDTAKSHRPTLTPESQIDDAIETALLLQLVESEAALELKTLVDLCSRLHDRDRPDLTVVPLRPLVCARALRDAVRQAAPDGSLQPVLLRGLGTAMAAQMREVYVELAHWLQQHGVQPLDDQTAPRRKARKAQATAPTDGALPVLTQRVGDDAPLPPAESMRELLAWARRNHRMANVQAAKVQTAKAQATPAMVPEQPPKLAEPEVVEVALPIEELMQEPQVPPATAEELMQRLFSELRRQTEGSSSMRGMLLPLELLGQSVAADAPEVWSNPNHAWWLLLDRLLAAAVVHDDLRSADQQILGQSLEGILQQMLACPVLDEATFKRSADGVQRLVSQLLERSASPAAEDVAALQRGADRADLEHSFRRQLAQRLQSAPAGAVMRRFLLEVWTEVMVAQALRHGATAPAVAAAARVVDDLMQLTTQTGPAFSRAQQVTLLRQVKEGLTDAGLPRTRIDAELKQLGELLGELLGKLPGDAARPRQSPPPSVAARAQAQASAPWQTPGPSHGPSHGRAEQPHAPKGRGQAAPAPASARPELKPEQWASTLQPGSVHRLFLQGVWMTVRLNWVGPGQRLFMFQSRHGGRSHTLTLRMLCKLREAGLATTIEDNLLRAQAMESLVRDHVA